MSDEKAETRIEPSFCRTCRQDTNHEIVYSREGKSGDPDEFYYREFWETLVCRGCDTVSLRQRVLSEDNLDHETNTIAPAFTVFPRVDRNALELKTFAGVPTVLVRLYRETIDSFNQEAVTLCAGGLRALIEGLCAEKRIKDGPIMRKRKPVLDKNGSPKRASNLAGKIEGLAERGVLTRSQATTLHSLRFMGNEALHELEQPSVEELRTGVVLIETILSAVFDLANHSATLKTLKQARRNAERAFAKRKAPKRPSPPTTPPPSATP